MVSCAKQSTLREADMIGNGDAFQVQQPAFLSQPDVTAKGELPGKSDFYLRLDDHATANLGAKAAQHKTFQARQIYRTELEKEQAGEQPQHLPEARGTPAKLGV